MTFPLALTEPQYDSQYGDDCCDCGGAYTDENGMAMCLVDGACEAKEALLF